MKVGKEREMIGGEIKEIWGEVRENRGNEGFGSN